MIARRRGEGMRTHSRWRPPAATPAGGQMAPPLPPAPPLAEDLSEDTPTAPGRHRLPILLLLTMLVVAGAIAREGHRGSAAASPQLPATPRAWVQAWTAAALENPGRVCHRLFAPALTAAYATDTGHSCVQYYRSVTSASFRVRHILQAGGTAAVEAHQVTAPRTWGYFTILLSHVQRGWQAVDLVPGGPVRAH
jgi:hypothetical protein